MPLPPRSECTSVDGRVMGGIFHTNVYECDGGIFKPFTGAELEDL